MKKKKAKVELPESWKRDMEDERKSRYEYLDISDLVKSIGEAGIKGPIIVRRKRKSRRLGGRRPRR